VLALLAIFSRQSKLPRLVQDPGAFHDCGTQILNVHKFHFSLDTQAFSKERTCSDKEDSKIVGRKYGNIGIEVLKVKSRNEDCLEDSC